MRLAVLFSGGKDSTLALYKAMKEKHEIKCLITIFPKRQDSWMFHYPCVELTKLQAESLGIRHIFKVTEGEKEKELEDLKKVLLSVKDEIDGVVSGALRSTYQRERIEKVCTSLNLKTFCPLWHKDSKKLLKDIIDAGFKVIIAGVSAEGFDDSWLGREIDYDCINDLEKLHQKYKINWGFEGGEAETLVLDGPIFKKRLEIIEKNTIWERDSGYLVIKRARLVNKI